MHMKTYLSVLVLLLATACSKDKDNVKFKVDEAQSTVKWKGSAPTHFHEGAFKVSGNVEVNDKNKVIAGNFTIPIASITNFDIEDEAIRKQLLDHLKSPDFFNIAIHPNASFKITKVEEYTESGTSWNTKITGEFTMLGQTHSINFPAQINADANKISTKGTFKLNRLQYGMNTYNDPEETLYILPEVDITLDIISNRS